MSLQGDDPGGRSGGGHAVKALFALASACLLAALAPGLAVGDDEGSLQITSCTADGSGTCETQQVQAEPVPTAESPAGSDAQPAKAPRVERHRVSLKTGKDAVTTDGAETVQQAEVAEAPDAAHHHSAAAPPTPGGALPIVSTDSGSPFSGLGSGLDFLAPDEALSRFAIPPFLLPIYVAAGRAYGVPWNLLASINQIETDFGRISHQVSSAGALGWMQFMPGTWASWGVDASGDGVADPYNPVDAIYAAARYLRASGAATDLRGAVLAYNHADWYADSVLKTAGVYGSLPSGLVNETGSLAFGRFPVRGAVSYGDDFRVAQLHGRPPRGIDITGGPGARAIATQNVRVERVLLDRDLAAKLGPHGLPQRGIRVVSQATLDAAAAMAAPDPAELRAHWLAHHLRAPELAAAGGVPRRSERGLPAGFARSRAPGIAIVVSDAVGNDYRYSGLASLSPRVHPGARLRGGQLIGRLPTADRPSLRFSVRAAGGEAVDPRPLVDGYRLQEVSDLYHALAPLGGSPFTPDTRQLSAGLVSGTDRQLARRVLDDPGIQLYPGGRADIEHGLIDKRVLGALLYLRRAGLTLGVSCLRTGHSYYTAGGSVSAHSYGAAVDIGSFNGQPVLGHQGPGSLTEQAIKLLMGVDGSARPAQLISLMTLGGPSFALADHADHLHVGYHFSQSIAVGRSGDALGSVAFDGRGVTGLFGQGAKHGSKGDERRLSDRLGRIANPTVRRGHSAAGVLVEGEAPHDAADAQRLASRPLPLRTVPAAAGARLLAVDVVAGEAWALGSVDGAARGWAHEQVVVLHRRDGIWRLVGPPRDAGGRVVDPDLRALSALAGGGGYAVGADGAVVQLRGNRSPLLLDAHTDATLRAVDARLTRTGSVGTAVGEKNVAVELTGASASRSRAPADAVSVVSGPAGTTVATADGTLFRRSGSSWRRIAPAPQLADGSSPRLTTLKARGSELWAAGGVRDAGGSDLPLAARWAHGRWSTWCAPAPGLAAIRELGTPTQVRRCDSDLPAAHGTTGAASSVAPSAAGVALATPGGILLLDGGTFRMLRTTGPGLKLALGSTGRGWALRPGGALVQIVARDDRTAEPTQKPASLGEATATAVAVTPGGAKAFAVGESAGAVDHAGSWASTPAPEDQLRALDFAGGSAWGIDADGALVHYDGESWSGPQVEGDHAADGAGGWAGLAFRHGGEGFAAGARGALARFDGDGWTAEASPTTEDLTAVAAGPHGAVAVGTAGTLLERGADGWEQRWGAGVLVGGADFTAATALPDGTLLAAAGGALLIREPHADAWVAAPLAPLGTTIRRLTARRDHGGALDVVVLTAGGSALEGTAAGWRDLGAGKVADLDLDPQTGTVWLAGPSGGRAGVATVNLTGGPA